MLPSNNLNLNCLLLNEALSYKDMDGMLKPTMHVDEFSSKIGDDADIIVVSFFVRSDLAARDLVSWFEKGYDWVIDADRSPGEITPGRYLVYVEMKRRSAAGRWLQHLLEDLSTLTEFQPKDWTMHYKNETHDWSPQTFDRLVPLSPKEYRLRNEKDLNEMRAAAGLDIKPVFETDQELKALQSAAGI